MAAFCSHCGNALASGNPRCTSCGKSNHRSGWLIGKAVHLFLLAIGAIGVCVLVVAALSSNSSKAASGAHAAGLFQKTVNLGDRVFALPAREFMYVRFDVPAGSSGAKVVGSFTAEGGSGNDVKVYVVPPDGLINFENDHGFREYYDSGQVTTGQIDAGPLPAGTYYLVYSNRFSLISNKTVYSTARLVYRGF